MARHIGKGHRCRRGRNVVEPVFTLEQKDGHFCPYNWLIGTVTPIWVPRADALRDELLDPGFRPVAGDVAEGMAAIWRRRRVGRAMDTFVQEDRHLRSSDRIVGAIGVIRET